MVKTERLPASQYDENVREFHELLKRDYKKFIKFYERWCGGKEKFIREIAFGYEGGAMRYLITDSRQLMRHMLFHCDPDQNAKRNRGPPHVWLSAFEYEVYESDGRPRPVYSSAVINVVPFDFDSPEDLQEALTDARTFDDIGLKNTVVFSGSKGFQAWVEPSRGLANASDLRDEQASFQAVYGLMSSDRAINGDVARVMRLPYTIHPATGLQARLCESDESLEVILERAGTVVSP